MGQGRSTGSTPSLSHPHTHSLSHTHTHTHAHTHTAPPLAPVMLIGLAGAFDGIHHAHAELERLSESFISDRIETGDPRRDRKPWKRLETLEETGSPKICTLHPEMSIQPSTVSSSPTTSRPFLTPKP